MILRFLAQAISSRQLDILVWIERQRSRIHMNFGIISVL